MLFEIEMAARVRWHFLILLLLLLLPIEANAQEPKKIQTVKIHKVPPGTSLLYEIDPEGDVLIDWDAAEALVETKADRVALPIAILMIAIRDGKWKPAQRKN